MPKHTSLVLKHSNKIVQTNVEFCILIDKCYAAKSEILSYSLNTIECMLTKIKFQIKLVELKGCFLQVRGSLAIPSQNLKFKISNQLIMFTFYVFGLVG